MWPKKPTQVCFGTDHQRRATSLSHTQTGEQAKPTSACHKPQGINTPVKLRWSSHTLQCPTQMLGLQDSFNKQRLAVRECRHWKPFQRCWRGTNLTPAEPPTNYIRTECSLKPKSSLSTGQLSQGRSHNFIQQL